MDIQATPQPKENNQKHHTAHTQDYAAAFTNKLNQALLVQAVTASEYAHQLKLKKKKETQLLSEKEEDLNEEEAFLKRKLSNILIRQQQSLGLF